ncbi:MULTISPECIES: sugar ABC transporter ATP-binding protein [Streptacidiphilus]|uniref:Sugar ABC transporter ATP-binding protein n=1 Tax=Streptacidiphilus cavernicola TaxID=3342716 RepID=A0ABV6UXT9_9ACTN|nr:sugar ABC transporter ATP-binding protein [Streptacidiphilus jeojiense]
MPAEHVGPPPVPPHPPRTVLAATAVGKRYDGIPVLAEAGITLRAGEVHALVGENGAGKSTLVKILSGVVRPDTGRVLLDGREVAFATSRQASAAGVALVSQELAIFGDLSVAENLFPHGLPRRAGLTSNAEAERRARPVLDELGLRLRLDTRAGDLDLADRQLLEICRALLTEPRVLILDEPTSALPKEAVDRLAAVLLRTRGRGIAVLYISHYLEEVLRFSQRVTVLRDGRVTLGGAEIATVDLAALVTAMLGEEHAAPEPRAAPAPAPASGPAREPGAAAVVLDSVTVPGRLDRVSLTARRREVVGLAGLQGAGHLTVLEVTGGRARPASGSVRLPGGVAPRSLRQATGHGVAFVPSDRKRYGLMLDRPVWENITSVSWLGLHRGGLLLHRRALVDRAARSARSLRVDGGVHRRTGELSGGNQQKVVFAKWLDTDPSVMLLDDPTRGVDIRARAEMHAVIRALADEGREGRAVLVASTDLSELVELCDRVLVLQRGRIVDELSGERLTQQALSVSMNAGFAG